MDAMIWLDGQPMRLQNQCGSGVPATERMGGCTNEP